MSITFLPYVTPRVTTGGNHRPHLQTNSCINKPAHLNNKEPVQDVAALGDYVYETMPSPALQILQADAYPGGPLVTLPKVLQSPTQELTSAVELQMAGLSVIRWTYKK